MADPPRPITWSDRRDGALAGTFFGTIAALVFLLLAVIMGVAGWIHEVAATFREFLTAQLAYAPIWIAGGGILGAIWDFRRSRYGRMTLWLIGSAVVSGSMISLLKAPVWRWDWKAVGWVALMTPLWAWVFASGSSRRAAKPGGRAG